MQTRTRSAAARGSGIISLLARETKSVKSILLLSVILPISFGVAWFKHSDSCEQQDRSSSPEILPNTPQRAQTVPSEN